MLDGSSKRGLFFLKLCSEESAFRDMLIDVPERCSVVNEAEEMKHLKVLDARKKCIHLHTQ